jgi:hypothetical protein
MMATLPEKRVGENTWLWGMLMMQRRVFAADVLALEQLAEMSVLNSSATLQSAAARQLRQLVAGNCSSCCSWWRAIAAAAMKQRAAGHA